MAPGITVAAMVILMAASGPPLAAQAGAPALAYRIPAAATVTYHATDTLAQTFSGPGGTATFTLATGLTLATTFEGDPDGVRVTADVESVSATMAAPMGTDALPVEVTGAYVFVLGPDGAVDVVSGPEIPGPAEAATPLAGLHHEWFPLLPGAAAEPGDSWSGTVTWSHEGSTSSTSSSTVFDYTLVGDTTVAGSTLWKILLAGQAELTSRTNQNGTDLTTNLAGANSGVALWDDDRGLLHSIRVTFDYSGTMNTPMGDLPISVQGSSSRWLEN
ncbi:MAG: hypothetical protein OXK77_07360 [Gemmatimonadota bacterium]|nr:hypothetical protein [Gemmatimonadota bacterium]MDE2864631.1 hypothetical protein [Gemmatimonadota bacterium]MXV94394.1 hypothetical protein [Gemmatimonadota bacterium]MYE15921.1 hypothetical protein [Gemmatimonadota bacterium]